MSGRLIPQTLAVMCVGLLVVGCGTDAPTHADVSHARAHGSMVSTLSRAELARVLGDLRARTAAWHNEAKAAEAGYTVAVGCTDERIEGLPASLARGMGYHTLKPELIDGRSTLLEPELLVYRRNPANGKLHLAGLDYFIPGDFYPGPSSPGYSGTPPVLEGLGMPMMWSDAFNGWIAHAWPWRHNPDGMFENFNPTVPICPCTVTPAQPLCT
jgi:hypothetical protein